MIKVGLTGNIGSGKSTVAKVFASLGVPIFYADIAAKDLLKEPLVIESIINAFGNSVIDKNGIIIRASLGEIVFNYPTKLKILNGIIHPKVKNNYITWLQKNCDSPYVVQEAAILIESGFNKLMDRVILVKAPENIRLQRVLQRDNLSEKLIKARMQRQLQESELEKYSDFIIDNNGKDLIIPQIIKIDAAIKKILCK